MAGQPVGRERSEEGGVVDEEERGRRGRRELCVWDIG